MPPTQRRADRSRMYNLAGHAHSSGSLLPRSTDVHAASASAGPSSSAAARGVDAADAPYLTNLESHFGRVTLTAPDNLLRKQAKEKKQKVRQRKAQNAHAAAAALAGPTHAALSPATPRNAGVSTGLLDPGRRYQATLDDASTANGSLLTAPGQHGVMRRAHSGNQTPTLASTSYLQTQPPSTPQTTATRVRRRRQSSARDDASRPASRASATSRPDSALSFNDNDTAQTNPSSAHTEDLPRRSRTESAPAAQRRSQNAFATPADTAPSGSSRAHPPRPAVQQSLHRQNVWNDITEDDPDDLPPPFPEGAPRPPTPPQPPSHSEAAADAQLIGPQPHARIPDSPPPPFVSDDEDEPTPARPPATEEPATDTRPDSRASTTSSASASADESVELTEERRAWESDLRNGLSFDVRLLREQQRRVARERAAAFRAREEQHTLAPEAEAETLEPVGDDARSGPQAQPAQLALRATAEASTPEADTAEQQEPNTAVRPALSQTVSEASLPAEATLDQPEDTPHQDDAHPRAEEAPAPEPAASAAAPRSQSTSAHEAAEAGPSLRARTANDVAEASGRLSLFNEPRLGLPPMPQASASEVPQGQSAARASRPSHILGHRKTNSDTPNSGPAADIMRSNAGIRASLGGAVGRRIDLAHATRAHGSDSHLPLSRRPEDTLFVISAPPPAVHAREASGDEASTSATKVDDSAVPARDAADVSSHEEDDGAESDSSIEQWLAEAAAFDALRKREDDAAARLQQLREPVAVSDSSDESERDMPGAFNARVSRRPARKVPDPENLKLMDDALPKAPPPLVLGRSRGGAAFSDSSDSTDTDDALDQYSSSDDDDDQHRAFRDAVAGAESVDAFANAHSSVHARNSSSAPNLSILSDDAQHDQRKPSPSAARASVGPERKLSLKARGKLPERPETLSTAGPSQKHEVPEARAGEFEEDSSSSRDVSDSDASVPPIPRSTKDVESRNDAASLARRTSLDPLLQPLGYGRSRPDVGGRLKGLFGQPLVGGSDGAATMGARSDLPVAHGLGTVPTVEGPRPMNSTRRASNRSVTGPDAVAEESAPVRAASSTQTPEQRARDETLAQIAQVSATTQAKHDSLAALERLLAKTGRPTSMLPPSAMSRAELGGRLHLTPGTAESDAPPSREKEDEAPPVPPARSRLSRQGAVRSRPAEALVASASGLSRAPSAARPVSFVNPRSSAAPLPRGRLPAITDATRHFPPSASTGPGVTPSWLAYIPAEEQNKLPAPLEPLRIGRVSQMVSRFEATPGAKYEKPASPIKPATASSSRLAPGSSRDGDAGVFRRFTSTEDGVVQRRPPPGPPTNSNSGDEGMDALTRQIDEAASAWTQPLLSVPGSTALPRSPRTVAMDTLTGREHGPSLPPKSPLMTQDHIVASASRNGLSASIAAAQAAAWARRERNEARPLPMLPESVRVQGLGVEAERSGLPVPPPLPSRPPRERWLESQSEGASSESVRQQAAQGQFADAAGTVSPSPGTRSADAQVRGNSSSAPSQRASTSGSAASRAAPSSQSEIASAIGSGASAAKGGRRMDSSVPSSGSGSGVQSRAYSSGFLTRPSVHSSLLAEPTAAPLAWRWAHTSAAVEPSDNASGAHSSDFFAEPSIHPGFFAEPTAAAAAYASPLAIQPRSNRSTSASQGAVTTSSSASEREADRTHPAARSEATSTAPAQAAAASSGTPADDAAPRRLPAREASLGLTDFDLLVAQLERDGMHYEQLSAIGDFLGPAKPTCATPEQLASLSVGRIECDARRVTREGKVKHKLSCVGVRVDKCTICLAQFKEDQNAVILPCSHVFHEDCAVNLLKTINTCPTCRHPAF